MLNIEEIKSCIEENLRENKVWESLIEDLKVFTCPRNRPGHKNFRVCNECHYIRCMDCNFRECQCWNDE